MSDSASATGLTLPGLLGIAFVVLKLAKVIDWSWWWVTAPFWGPAIILLAAIVVFLVLHWAFKRKR